MGQPESEGSDGCLLLNLQAYKGGYWESRAKGRWDGCRDIFGG